MADANQIHAKTDSGSPSSSNGNRPCPSKAVPAQNGNWAVQLVCQLVGAPRDAATVPSVN